MMDGYLVFHPLASLPTLQAWDRVSFVDVISGWWVDKSMKEPIYSVDISLVDVPADLPENHVLQIATQAAKEHQSLTPFS